MLTGKGSQSLRRKQDRRGSEKDGRIKKVRGWVSWFQSQWLHMVFVGRGRLTATVCSCNESVCAGRAKGLIKTVLKGSVISSFQPTKTRILCACVCAPHANMHLCTHRCWTKKKLCDSPIIQFLFVYFLKVLSSV